MSQPPGSIAAGPEDSRMFVVDAPNKIRYGATGSLPPQQTGLRLSPVPPGPDGHFDHIDPNSREFKSTTMYATVRRTLDIWQDYHGAKIEWVFRGTFAKMLLIPAVEWDNAQSGYGFLEFGYGRKPGPGGIPVIDHDSPFCENFDVLAHEIGHNILFTLVGIPNQGDTTEYDGFQESGGDLTAIVAVMHFDSVVDHVLQNSKGNLFTVNELSRLGELANGREIRRAFNALKMSDVDTEPHNLSQPLTGAIFDIFVEAFQMELVGRGLITQQLADRSEYGRAPASELAAINAAFAAAYVGREADFKTAMLVARDYLGQLLAKTWAALHANFPLTYTKVLTGLLDADEELTSGAHANSIRECFAWREIVAAPPADFMIRKLSDCGMADLLEANPEHEGDGFSQPSPIVERMMTKAPYIEGRAPRSRRRLKTKAISE